MKFENRRDTKRKKCFASWKAYFSSCYFFNAHFLFHIKKDF